MWQPRVGISWDARGDGKTVVRLNAGLFYARVPGLNLASSRSTNGSAGPERLPRQLLQRLRRHPADLPEPAASRGAARARRTTRPSSPSTGLPEPEDVVGRVGVEREVVKDHALLVQYNYAKGEHITRFFEQNDAAFGCPWGRGSGPTGRTASPAAPAGARADEGRGHGQEPLQRASPSA